MTKTKKQIAKQLLSRGACPKKVKQLQLESANPYAMVAYGAQQTWRDPRIQQYLMNAAQNWGNQAYNSAVNYMTGPRKPKPSKISLPASYAPVAINTRARNRTARVQGVSGGIVIKHREYISDVSGNTTFGATSCQVQPGMAATFPWLSSIAGNFEKYRIRKLSLQYVNVAATSERGRVTLAFDRDPLDADPVTKVDLFSYSGAVEGSVWSPLSLNIPVGSTSLFTRSGTVTGTDLKTYDLGKLVVGVSNTADTATIGELFLSYEIELTIPQPAVCPSVYAVAGGTISKTAIFGDVPVLLGSFPCTILDSTVTFLTPGTFFISIRVTGTAPGSPTVNTGTCTNGAYTAVTDGNASSVGSSVFLEVRATIPGQTFICTFGGTAVTASRMTICQSSGAEL